MELENKHRKELKLGPMAVLTGIPLVVLLICRSSHTPNKGEVLRDVVITGCGVLTSAGASRQVVGRALRANRFCATSYPGDLPIKDVAVVPESALCSAEECRELFPDDRKCRLGLMALLEALSEALNVSQRSASEWLAGDALAPYFGVRHDQLALFVGTGLSSITPAEIECDLVPFLSEILDRSAMAQDISPDFPVGSGSRRISPNRHLPNRFATTVSDLLRIEGPVDSNFSACAAAAQAIAEGFRAVRRGQVEVAVVGGHDSMNHPMGLLSFQVLGALSTSQCRPFSANRDGFMLGEGASYFVLESAEHARSRGATAIATVLGAGTSIDAWNATAPHPQGRCRKAMRRALKDAGLTAADVNMLMLTVRDSLGDAAEASAIQRVLMTFRSPIKGQSGTRLRQLVRLKLLLASTYRVWLSCGNGRI